MKINGVGVGYSTDSKLPAEFDITNSVLKAGTHGSNCGPATGAGAINSPDAGYTAVVVELVVLCWSAGSYLEDQDMWHFAGITRSCWLLARPAVSVCVCLVNDDEQMTVAQDYTPEDV